MIQNKKGFTLIEMLVVIAVVGILSAAVLTALGPSRNKAKDARIISDLNQFRAAAETVYVNDYSGIDLTKDPFKGLKADVELQGGSGTFVYNLATNNLSYAVGATLTTTGYYCVDSNGSSKPEGSALGAATACP